MEDWELYLVTEEDLSAGRKTMDVVKEAVAGGVDVVQLREKNKTTRAKYQLGQKIKRTLDNTGVDFIINDDPALALALDADGVHLGDDDLTIKAAREILGPDKIIGYSTSNLAEVEQAKQQGADYVGFGAIYHTSSKDVQSRRQGIGLERLKQLSPEVKIPIVAIGGINAGNIAKVKEAGADTIAMISAITGAENVKKEVQNLKNKMGCKND
ncbi:thiamine phosphate synthase [Halanaerobacter jeridensis]|uniref:Thiamine-phosphate synthase n=1 Tax=Halanaerobacter jeridensis TaxID=706427 RepID=A0A938XUY1_9FIRM|nr:thiamine phosphate synthase [Halanaerobacter jeridensis]MBM7558018.1 thiamine-phosphate pyrophosphorylase [Halanaerobacter jeridensis]